MVIRQILTREARWARDHLDVKYLHKILDQLDYEVSGERPGTIRNEIHTCFLFGKDCLKKWQQERTPSGRKNQLTSVCGFIWSGERLLLDIERDYK